MAIRVDRYIGTNGDVLIPINQNADNSAPLLSTKKGTYYFAQTTDDTPSDQGMLGLSLAFAAMPPA